MIDITTYITEGGFFKNTGANKYIDIIKNFGKILADEAVQEELNTAKWSTNMPNTNVFKQLYDIFNDINKYEVKFDVVYNISTSLSGPPDVCTQHWVGIRNGDEFSFSCKEIWTGVHRVNRNTLFKYKDAVGFLSDILYYIRYAQRLDVLRDTAKFIVK